MERTQKELFDDWFKLSDACLSLNDIIQVESETFKKEEIEAWIILFQRFCDSTRILAEETYQFLKKREV